MTQDKKNIYWETLSNQLQQAPIDLNKLSITLRDVDQETCILLIDESLEVVVSRDTTIAIKSVISHGQHFNLFTDLLPSKPLTELGFSLPKYLYRSYILGQILLEVDLELQALAIICDGYSPDNIDNQKYIIQDRGITYYVKDLDESGTLKIYFKVNTDTLIYGFKILHEQNLLIEVNYK